MKYMGSKQRIAKDILPIILKNRKENQYYVEPFCGGLSTIQLVTGKRIASDNNFYLIEMWKGLQSGKKLIYPISKELYSLARDEYNKKTSNLLTNFEIACIGWTASYNGRFFDGGYSGQVKNRNYVLEQYYNISKQIPLLNEIEFYNCDYKDLEIPSNSIIYCDIPYKNTKKYSRYSFDHDYFWEWAKQKKKDGHHVYISEYNAPEDFECIWHGKIRNNMKLSNKYLCVEKLFIPK